MGGDENLPPTPCPPRFPSSSSSALLKDISNLKTPKCSSKIRNPNPSPSTSTRYFTAMKKTPAATPSSSRFRRDPRSATAARRKLKAFELETMSSRKEEIKKEQALRCLSKSLATWLNFLIQNPASCGCGAGSEGGAGDMAGLGKREHGGPAGWRCPKRQRSNEVELVVAISGSKKMKNGHVALGESLREVCSLEDLKERMRAYLSLDACKEVLDAMARVVKNIDEGRLRMKSHCPIVTDVGMKEKATRVLMSYNQFWLSIGLHIIFGGDSLLSDGNETSELEMTLKMVIEKQFFSHAGLAKAYAYNKMVEGLYRPGYYENLGNIILKRFLLLVLILDRAKLHSALPLKYGIDGVDGGSPLLFSLPSSVSSSRQVINDFLSSDVMHGEGNLLAHLEMVGFRVSYEQLHLVEYDFSVNDLFVDLQDGVRLSRAIQLLLNDSSILTKLAVPSDTRKKHLANCNIVLKYLQSVGVPLHDEDGIAITEDDIVLGDKELTVSLLWNMFVHLQFPLLINKLILLEEVVKIRGSILDPATTVTSNSSALDLLFSWIQTICEKYDYKIEGLLPLVDGKAIWCLLDYYFRKEFHCPRTLEGPNQNGSKESIMSAMEYTDAVHNFILSQKLTTLLGNFPEVLQISDILEHRGAPSYQSVVILLVFLASQLTMKKAQVNFHKLLRCECQTPERRLLRIERSSIGWKASQEESDVDDTEDAAKKFKAIKTWWQGMAEKNGAFVPEKSTVIAQYGSTRKNSTNIQKASGSYSPEAGEVSETEKQVTSENLLSHQQKSATKIQTCFRLWRIRKQFLNQKQAIIQMQIGVRRMKNRRSLDSAAIIIQSHIRAWIARRMIAETKKRVTSDNLLSNLQIAATKIQTRFRVWQVRKQFLNLKQAITKIQIGAHRMKTRRSLDSAAIIIQSHIRAWIARRTVTEIQKQVTSDNLRIDQQIAATKIQTCFRLWRARKQFLNQKHAIMKIQIGVRRMKTRRSLDSAATIIQSHIRAWIARRMVGRQRYLVSVLQRCCRVWMIRKNFLSQTEAVIKIQSIVRCVSCSMTFQRQKGAAIQIQRFARGQIARNKLLGAFHSCVSMVYYSNEYASVGFCQSSELKLVLSSISKLQRWWRGILLLKQRTRSATLIQSHFRGWIGRQRAYREMQSIVVIQRCCRVWMTRKNFLSQRQAVIKIQSIVRCVSCSKTFQRQKCAAIQIQRFARGQIARNKLLGAFHSGVSMAYYSNESASTGCCQSFELKLVLSSILKLQRWWRGICLLKQRTRSAILIQSHFRGWIGRQRASREMQSAIVIQSYWKGYCARKKSREQLLDLRIRIHNSAKNVDDSLRIINRLISALSELESMKSTSGILHTCITLDTTTQHSQKCCERLVEAGAIDSLLKLIRSVSRSIPDQEILKHSLSTLRNLARYSHLVEVLIVSRGSAETLLWELLRNKEEGYFIAADILKMICATREGANAMRRLPALLKRLSGLVEEHKRKAIIEKRNPRGRVARENAERRMKEAIEILTLTANS